jgi:hypothetical protein
MTEQIIKAHRHPRGRAKTSVRAIKLKQRQADVLTYRLAGHSFAAIGKQLGISPDTAHRDAVAAIARIVPVETAQEVLKAELLKLDAMATGVYENAVHGDTMAIDAMLSIMRMRGRYLGLFPDGKGGGVHVNIGGSAEVLNAEDTGIQVEFIRATKWGSADTEREVNAKLLDLPVVNGGFNGSKP